MTDDDLDVQPREDHTPTRRTIRRDRVLVSMSLLALIFAFVTSFDTRIPWWVLFSLIGVSIGSYLASVILEKLDRRR
jgi:hypothetical protein